eukprot:4087385-Lingulodinium_polyedra.AAC.1
MPPQADPLARGQTVLQHGGGRPGHPRLPQGNRPGLRKLHVLSKLGWPRRCGPSTTLTGLGPADHSFNAAPHAGALGAPTH